LFDAAAKRTVICGESVDESASVAVGRRRARPSDVVGLAKVMPPLSRRGFMSSSAAAAAGYTLAAGPVRADVIHTETKGLEAGNPKAGVAGGFSPVFSARPWGGQPPPITLVCMEIFGIHEFIKDVTRRLANLGAFAVAPDYYFRLGDTTKVTDSQELLPKVNSKVTPNCSPIWTPPSLGQNRKAAT